MMNKNRRKFIHAAGAAVTGAMLFPQYACKENTVKAAADVVSAVIKPSLTDFGIQLYTVRDVIPADPMGTIKKLAGMGFNQIEGYEGPQGMFWNLGNVEFKKQISDLGIDMVSCHVDINKDFELKVAAAAEIGIKYLLCPYVGPQKSMDDWKKVTDKFNNCGAICKKHGIRFAYHNHAYSFKAFSGMIPHDFIMDNTDPDTVDHEMDIYWVVTGAADPIDYLKKYSNRFKLCHIKDRMIDAGDEREASCDLGTGMIDYSTILKVAEDNGMEYFIMEQERYDGSDPLTSAKVGAEYLKKLVFT